MQRLLPYFFWIMGIFAPIMAQELAQYGDIPLTTSKLTDTTKSMTSTNHLPIDVNFLFNYYEQDGNHSAVTGGIGTEKLEDRAAALTVHVPMDSIVSLTGELAANWYSSASTDNINTRVSSASSEDLRGYMKFQYTQKQPQKRQAFSFMLGGSIESDYISSSIGGSWTIASKDENQSFGISALAYLDNWVVIFPDELRELGITWVEDDKRRSYNLALFYNQIIHRKLQVSLAMDVVYQTGLLSTPFHRVFFKDETDSKVERLPNQRWKWPIGLRLHYYALDDMVFRFYYRWYLDNFGIAAHTTSLELPIKLGLNWMIAPFYRFHHQTAADYFQPYGQHLPQASFFTSDFDLSGFNSSKYGIGIRYTPLWGISRFKWSSTQISKWKSIDLRLARYVRSDGLKAFMISLDLGFLIE